MHAVMEGLGFAVVGQALGYSAGPEYIVVALLAILYFVPTLVALRRKVPNAGSVVVINIFLGWTLIGWVVALAMAARTSDGPAGSPQRPKSPENVTYTHSGTRYLFGTTFNPPSYAIWDREGLEAPVQVFPYTEHGKAEGFARFESMESRYEELPPQGKSEQPSS